MATVPGPSRLQAYAAGAIAGASILAMTLELAACSSTSGGGAAPGSASDASSPWTGGADAQSDAPAAGGLACAQLIACVCVEPSSTQCLAVTRLANNAMSQGGNAYADEVCSQQVSTQPLTYALCFGDSGAVEAGTGSDEGSVDGTLDAPESAGDEAGEGGFDAMPDALPSDAQGLDDAMEIDAAADGD
jgi:hypothetical protein